MTGVKTMRVLVAIVFVAAVAVIAASVVVIKQSNRIASIERKLGSGSLAQVATLADRDSHNTHFSLPSADNSARIDGVLLEDGSAFILGGDVPKTASGNVYQLWALTSAGSVVSLGVLSDDATEPFAFNVPEGTERLSVTSERVATVSPTDVTVVSGPLPK